MSQERDNWLILDNQQPNATAKSFGAVAISYLKPRPLGAFLLGISSGFPLTLLLATMSYWLSKVGIDKKTIGFAFALGTPYTLNSCGRR